jgi:hypothetical protein
MKDLSIKKNFIALHSRGGAEAFFFGIGAVDGDL